MMDASEANSRLETLRQAFADTYGVKGSFEVQVAKTKRLLPRYERGQAHQLVRVEQVLEAPGEADQIDRDAFERAELALNMYLETLDDRDQQKGFAVDVTMNVLVNVALGIAALTVLWFFISAE
ncbi:MAG: hypothetical protein AAFP28_12210 [Pseudomonadota bacterium]